MDSCKTGCRVAATSWSENAAGKAVTACTSLDADLREGCYVGFERFNSDDNSFTPLDYESKPVYPVVVEVKDRSGMSSTGIFTVILVDKFESPVLENGQDAEIKVA